MDVEETFRYLKPFCVEVAQNPTLKSIGYLQAALKSVEDKILNEKTMVEYVLFPLKLTIQRIGKKNENLLIKTLECMTFIFQSANITSEALFVDIFDTACVLLSSMKQPVGKDILANISEELKLSIIMCLRHLLQNSTKKTLLCLFKKKMLPRLGHAVSLLLALSQFEVDRNLRQNSLECLQYLSLKHKALDEHSLQSVIDTFCSFIPGISLSLSRILTDHSNLGQNVIACVVETLKQSILLVMSDSKFCFIKKTSTKEVLAKKINEMYAKVNSQTPLDPPTKQPKDTSSISVERSQAWMEVTSSNISILIDKIIPRIAYHSSFKVRLATVHFSESILTECNTSMRACAPRLIETLAAMRHDDHEKVSAAAKHAIDAVRGVIEKGGESFLLIVKEKLYERLLSLPRIMKGASDDKKLLALNLLLGYFNLLGRQIRKILNSITMLEKILKAFIQVLELDIHGVKIVEEKNPVSSEDMIGRSKDSAVAANEIEVHCFKNFKDNNIFLTIRKICQSIGRFSDLEIMIDYLLEKFLSSSAQRKEVVLLLNEILRSKIDVGCEDETSLHENDEDRWFDGNSTFKYSSIIDQVLSTFLQDDFWYLPTSNVTDVSGTQRDFLDDQLSLLRIEENKKELAYWEKGIPIEQINSNIQLICLMINGISVCSSVMRKDFHVYLIKVLYPVLEKLGNENAQIAKCAHSTLSIVSSNCGEKSMAELLLHNADYLVNSVSMSFRRLTLFSSAPCVLSVMLTYSNVDILPMVADVIQDVFTCLDTYQDEVTLSLMKVLKSFVSAVNIWFDDEADENSRQKDEPKRQEAWNKLVTPLELRGFLTDYCKLKLEALGQFNEDNGDIPENLQEALVDESAEAASSNVDKKKKIPLHFEATLMTLEKCQHFLSSKDVRLKLLILDVVETSVEALKNRTDDLLPAIHKIWPPIVGRMRDPNQVVASRTLEVICTMIACSGDFLRQRMTKDMLPFAVSFLQKQKTASLKSSTTYRFTSSCKLQSRLIILIGNMIKNLGLSDEDLMKTIVALSNYLDCRQPQNLQLEATNALNNAKRADWNKTWLILTSLYSTKELKAPNESFKDIQLDIKAYSRNEFTDNVVRILYDDCPSTR